MNIQEEKRVCFDVDQNKQKINFLLRKNKENETQQTELNQKLATAQSDINSLSSAVETLQNSTPTEEKIELLSYDIVKIVDNTYRDTLWKPKTIFFATQPNSKVKFKVSFTTKNTFDKSLPRIATTKIILDDVEIHSSEKSYENGAEETPFEFTYIFTTNKGGHKLDIRILTNSPMSTFTQYIKPDFFIVELFGTNVQFITKNQDFMVISNDTQNLMTTTCIDANPRFSLQTADENLSLQHSAFSTAKLGTYRNFNFISPYFEYKFQEDGSVVHSHLPSIFWASYPNYSEYFRVSYRTDITSEDLKDVIQHLHAIPDATAYAPTLKNSNDQAESFNTYPNLYYIKNNTVCVQLRYSFNEQIKNTGEVFADVAGVWRLDNFEDGKDILGIITREDGTSFLTKYAGYNVAPPKYELGFGTNINAYLRANDDIEIYMRYGKDIKKLIVRKNETTQDYEICLTQIIPNVQEYWLGANGTHFERVGNKIKYYLSGATTPTQTFEVFF